MINQEWIENKLINKNIKNLTPISKEWGFLFNKVFINMTLKENIQRIKSMMRIVEDKNSTIKKDTLEKNSVKYVIFVSGSEKSKSHEEQLTLFTKGFGTEYLVKGYRQSSLTSIVDFIKKNPVVAVILYSASCKLANQLNFSSNKIFCIEPWNGDVSDAGKSNIYLNIPQKNMYIDYESYARGKGTKVGANKTNHNAGHFVALTTSSADISKKVE